ncbi:hypothetical protein MAR_001817 [Mya arenaria]|uniref:Uncharacterized protein n=1 Tax=Mya arenaria TaxID=6604 RepID=A0ABY7FF13_MYAAR|nr:hypothetical protein MAR_001817 [Mya arenaria]
MTVQDAIRTPVGCDSSIRFTKKYRVSCIVTYRGGQSNVKYYLKPVLDPTLPKWTYNMMSSQRSTVFQ